jgi:hypothetical protein
MFYLFFEACCVYVAASSQCPSHAVHGASVICRINFAGVPSGPPACQSNSSNVGSRRIV